MLNILDTCILAVFLFFILTGAYKGFLHTALSLGAYLLSWLLGMLLMPMCANLVKGNARLFDMMLYYTEGSEYVANIPNGGVEWARTNIASFTSQELAEILQAANTPYPMGKSILKNIANESFAQSGVTGLGDYFNQTIVCVFINILVFLLIFFLFRLIIAFFINGVDYSFQLPVLRSGDWLLGGALGVLRGVLALFLIFMLLPILLVVLGQFDFVSAIVEESFFAPFFYRSNFLLSLIPGT